MQFETQEFRRSSLYPYGLVVVTFAGLFTWPALANVTLTPDQAILDCHAHAVNALAPGDHAIQATRRYHSVRYENGGYQIVGHFKDGEGHAAHEFDVECFVMPEKGVVEFRILTSPIMSNEEAMARNLDLLIDAPTTQLDPRLNELSFQQALYVIDGIKQDRLIRLHEMIHSGLVEVPENVRTAIDANVSILLHGRAIDR